MICDDGISKDTYKKFQDSHPMLFGRPSQEEEQLVYNNFMHIATTTKGFDGVLGIMDSYKERIKNKTREQILEMQRSMMTNLPSRELTDKIKNRDFSFILRYFKEGYADKEDYGHTLQWFLLTVLEEIPTKEELIFLKQILLLLQERFIQENDEKNKEKVKKIMEQLSINNL